jgi:hypothetical protein
MFALAVTAAIRTGAPRHTPSWALRSSVIYLLELILATVGALYALLTVAIHTVFRGVVPTTISREGFIWAQEATKVANEELASLQEQLERLKVDLTERPEQIAHGRGNPS